MGRLGSKGTMWQKKETMAKSQWAREARRILMLQGISQAISPSERTRYYYAYLTERSNIDTTGAIRHLASNVLRRGVTRSNI